ncbi:MAG: PAS domain S-box protein, partial [Okeania sp. SIO3B3]|nr:PAS domain S-box protein [Okeania sp. SIO3B3]
MTQDYRRNVESRIAAEQDRSMILNSINEGILLIDKDYIIRDVNPAATRIYGLSEEELLGKQCHEILAQSPVPCLNCRTKSFLEGAEGLYRERVIPGGKSYYER